MTTINLLGRDHGPAQAHLKCSHSEEVAGVPDQESDVLRVLRRLYVTSNILSAQSLPEELPTSKKCQDVRTTMTMKTTTDTARSISEFEVLQLVLSLTQISIRRMSRPPMPAPRIIRRQYSDPFIHLADSEGRRGYLDTPPPMREASAELALAPRSRSHVSSHHRVTSTPFPRRKTYSNSDDDFGERGRSSSYRRPSSRSGRSRGRSRSQSRFREDSKSEYSDLPASANLL